MKLGYWVAMLLLITAWASAQEPGMTQEEFQEYVVAELAVQRRMLEAQERATRELVMDMRMRRWKKDDLGRSAQGWAPSP